MLGSEPKPDHGVCLTRDRCPNRDLVVDDIIRRLKDVPLKALRVYVQRVVRVSRVKSFRKVVEEREPWFLSSHSVDWIGRIACRYFVSHNGILARCVLSVYVRKYRHADAIHQKAEDRFREVGQVHADPAGQHGRVDY